MLKEMVLALLSESALALSDDVVEAIVDKTIMEADSKGDGRIDPDEWKEFVARNPSLIKNMTLPYLKDLTLAFPSFLPDTEVQDSEGLPRKIHRWYQVPFPDAPNTSKDVMENLVVS